MAPPVENQQITFNHLKERSHTDEKGYTIQEGSGKRFGCFIPV
jgi:hypothetical protein